MATEEINKRIFRLRKGDNKESISINGGSINDLQKEFDNMTSKQSKPLSNISIKSYISKINRTAIMQTGKPYEDYKFLLDADKIIKKIQDSDLKSKKDYLSAISKLLRHKKVDSDILDKYKVGMQIEKTAETKVRGDNLAKKDDIEKTNNMSLNDIQNKIKNYSVLDDGNIDDEKLINKVIASFYFMNFDSQGLPNFVPRNDLPEMKLINSNKAKKQIPNEFNYIVMEGNIPTKIIMQNYKTKNTYGKQTFIISKELSQILQQYLQHYKKQNGDLLFVMRDGKPFKHSNFTNLIQNSMKAVIGKPLGIDLIRQIILSNLYNSKPLMSINQKDQIARAFLHSSNVSQEYLKPQLIKKE
jgi:hypothetical protein